MKRSSSRGVDDDAENGGDVNDVDGQATWRAIEEASAPGSASATWLMEWGALQKCAGVVVVVVKALKAEGKHKVGRQACPWLWLWDRRSR